MDLLLTAGIGDAIAVLQHCPELPKNVFLATPRADCIGELLYYLNLPCKTIEAHHTYYFRCQVEANHGPIDAEDGSISVSFPKILSGEWTFQRPLFAGKKFPRIIQEEYTLLCPASMNLQAHRDLTADKLNQVISCTQRKIVVCNKGNFPIKPRPRVIDYSNRTNMTESLALIFHAHDVITIDTWVVVAAASMGKPTIVKSINPNYYQHRTIYTAPHVDRITSKIWLG